MKIACLGWGSLVWKPDDLPVSGKWHENGPWLPLEFCRVGDGGELATALCANAQACQALWTSLEVTELGLAVEALRRREAVPDDRCDGIGSLVVDASTEGVIGQWAREQGLDAVVWTDLPPRIDRIEGRIPSPQKALQYLQGLEGETLEHARHYVTSVPAQIDTAYRRLIAQQLGWR